MQQLPIGNVLPYPQNNRTHPAKQIERISNSIKEFGFNQPIVVDEKNEILVGHGRLLAAQRLKLETVPVVKLEKLSENQKRAYRIIDNKLQNDSEWDLGNLESELALLRDSDFDIERYGLDEFAEDYFGSAEEDGTYAKKIDSPVYQITGKQPKVAELFNHEKYSKLCAAIKADTTLEDEQRAFLLFAATRHIVFDYQNIAEYYAHGPKNVQRLMEDSALVIIDFNQAIDSGFVVLSEELAETYRDDERQAE